MTDNKIPCEFVDKNKDTYGWLDRCIDGDILMKQYIFDHDDKINNLMLLHIFHGIILIEAYNQYKNTFLSFETYDQPESIYENKCNELKYGVLSNNDKTSCILLLFVDALISNDRWLIYHYINHICDNNNIYTIESIIDKLYFMTANRQSVKITSCNADFADIIVHDYIDENGNVHQSSIIYDDMHLFSTETIKLSLYNMLLPKSDDTEID